VSADRQSSWLEGEDGTPVPLEGGVEKRFGRYVLSRRIASGGMGTVYLARAVGPGGFDLPVAIKVIHPHLARRRDLVEMFLDEARITARIRHPNVCSVLDFGETEGTWFLAMEYLLGETLSSVIGNLQDDPAAMDDPRYRAISLRILADACEGLHAAHELRDADGRPMNVVHRDVSPHNLFITYDGAVKVLDFGIALARDRVHQTTTGGLKGKYAYMPPEQLQKRPLDRRADV
jgi:serine/threonine-protein kinase